MVSPVTSTACCRRVYYARSCYGIPLWAGRAWLLQAGRGGLCSQAVGSLASNTAILPARAVAPAAYVELRALDIARQEAQVEPCNAGGAGEPTSMRRLWPFRWIPAGITTSSAAPSSGAVAAAVALQDTSSATGRYLDVLV